MSASLDCVLRPRRVAVIGASRTPNTIGHEIVANLVGYGFTGTVFPVNPKADAIHSLKTYPTIGAVPDHVDMAVITVPKQYVLGVAEECGQAGVQGLTVISAGFREVGGEGIELERQGEFSAAVDHFEAAIPHTTETIATSLRHEAALLRRIINERERTDCCRPATA